MSDCTEERHFLWDCWSSLDQEGVKMSKQCIKNRKKGGKKKKKKKEKDELKKALVKGKEKKKKENATSSEHPHSFDDDHAPNSNLGSKVSQKKIKGKKRVTFDLPEGCVRVKRPKFASVSRNDCVDTGNCRGNCSDGQGHLEQEESPGTSEDVNSQDLFITQKTFRTPTPPSPSDNRIPDDNFLHHHHSMMEKDDTRSSILTQEEKLSSFQRVKPNKKSSVLNSDILEPKTPKQHLDKPSLLHHVITQNTLKDSTYSPSEKHMQEASSMKLKTKLTKTKRVTNLKSNSSIDCPFMANQPRLDVPKPKTSKPQKDTLSTICHPSRTDSSTQTDNFFTTELSLYLNFCKRRSVTLAVARLQNARALDLRLPHRVESQDQHHPWNPRSVPPPPPTSGAVQVKEVEKETEERDHHQQHCIKETPSPQSEAKSTNTTPPSEDSEVLCCTGKLDRTQVRAVQTRLNESFFFRNKGKQESHRPDSPLMKLALGQDPKKKKRH